MTAEVCWMQGVAIWQLFTGATVLSPLCISMLWALYNAIPPYLILHFAIFGRVSCYATCSRELHHCLLLECSCSSVIQVNWPWDMETCF